MNKKFSAKAVRDGAMMAALTVIFILMSLYVPIFSFLGMFFSGLPLAVLYIKHGLRPTVYALVVSVVILFALTTNILSILSLVVSNGLPGIVAGVCVKKKYKLFNSVIYTGTAFLLGFMVNLMIIRFFMGGIEQLFNQMFEMMQQTFREFGAVISKASGKEFGESEITAIMNVMKNTFRLYFPSTIIIISLASGYIIYSVYVFILKKLRLTGIIPTPFCMLRASRRMGNVAIIFYLLSMFMDEKSLIGAAVLNVSYVLYTIIGICGLSFIDFKLSAKIPKGAVRFLIYVLILFLGGIIMTLIINVCLIAGLLDSSMNYRRISSIMDEDSFEDRSGEV